MEYQFDFAESKARPWCVEVRSIVSVINVECSFLLTTSAISFLLRIRLILVESSTTIDIG